MKYKIIDCNYSEEFGTSYVKIRTPRGEFLGTAICHPEEEYPSATAGCRYAEIRALIKDAKAHKKELKLQLSSLMILDRELRDMNGYNPASLETVKLRTRINEYQLEIERLQSQIENAEDGLKKAFVERNKAIARIHKVETKNL